jgi:1-acyl-sn-glycerol-3-phosphate acyltransferase
MRALLGAARLALFLMASMVTIIVQTTILSILRLRGKRVALVWPKLFHDFCARLVGLKVLVEGQPVRGDHIVYIGNHVSYFDVQAVGGIIEGTFIAKKDIESWPFFGLMGKMGQTIYMSRNPADAAREGQMFEERLKEPSPIIIFPEGTSSNGESILPFKSSLFQMFLNKNIIIQPFTISIMEVEGKTPVTTAMRDHYAWHGDMDLIPHLWAFVKSKGAVVKITFQNPITIHSFKDRKTLCDACYSSVVKGLDLSTSAPYGLSPQPDAAEQTLFQEPLCQSRQMK